MFELDAISRSVVDIHVVYRDIIGVHQSEGIVVAVSAERGSVAQYFEAADGDVADTMTITLDYPLPWLPLSFLVRDHRQYGISITLQDGVTRQTNGVAHGVGRWAFQVHCGELVVCSYPLQCLVDFHLVIGTVAVEVAGAICGNIDYPPFGFGLCIPLPLLETLLFIHYAFDARGHIIGGHTGTHHGQQQSRQD